jgi:hypothetical protein
MRIPGRTGPRDGAASQSHTLRITLAVVAAMLSVGVVVVGQDEVKAKKLVLFDGKGLDGWKVSGFLRAGEVKVEGGAIVMAEGDPMTGITSTRKDLPTTDYELSYEAKRLSGDDFFAAATFPVGMSWATFVNGGWGGNITGISSLDGADASENETGKFVKYQDETWYRFRVRVTDKMIRCWIDDAEVVAVEIEGRKVGTRIEVRQNEPLGFATYRSSSAVRKIEVRPLKPSEVAAPAKPDR